MIIRPSDIDTFSESPRRWFFEYSRLVARVGGGRELAKLAARLRERPPWLVEYYRLVARERRNRERRLRELLDEIKT